MRADILDTKIPRVGDCFISVGRVFHSDIVLGKKEDLKIFDVDKWLIYVGLCLKPSRP